MAFLRWVMEKARSSGAVEFRADLRPTDATTELHLLFRQADLRAAVEAGRDPDSALTLHRDLRGDLPQWPSWLDVSDRTDHTCTNRSFDADSQHLRRENPPQVTTEMQSISVVKGFIDTETCTSQRRKNRADGQAWYNRPYRPDVHATMGSVSHVSAPLAPFRRTVQKVTVCPSARSSSHVVGGLLAPFASWHSPLRP
ncbi:hypothetical protein [Streptomyces rishiriensis]|uniref:Uncharacterized protein n=1 Tax=Streptomyces rishiriensis TaxID=68264 RepID=A0ABU0P313_STRRH|nr:hypothetical protein [Streptomyces rishiriensis]MDQ0585797.1 hypothetical protein [Streptomyces rishiriensis]